MPSLGCREYEYKARWSALLFGVLLSGVGAAVAATLAELHCPLAVWGMRLPQETAVGVWLSLATTALVGALLFVIMAVYRLIRIQQIVLTPTAIIVPKGRFSSSVATIPFKTIEGLSVSQVYRQRFLKINYQRGTFTIASPLLPKSEDFEEVHYLLEELVRAATGGAVGG